MFKQISDKVSLPDLERDVLAQWQSSDLFKKSLDARKDAPDYTFYEGPPTANGRPGIHHVFARTIKDLVCRLLPKNGFEDDVKARWDTQALLVEMQVDQKLRLQHEGQHQTDGTG